MSLPLYCQLTWIVLVIISQRFKPIYWAGIRVQVPGCCLKPPIDSATTINRGVWPAFGVVFVGRYQTSPPILLSRGEEATAKIAAKTEKKTTAKASLQSLQHPLRPAPKN
jgi:hypothetical protein